MSRSRFNWAWIALGVIAGCASAPPSPLPYRWAVLLADGDVTRREPNDDATPACAIPMQRGQEVRLLPAPATPATPEWTYVQSTYSDCQVDGAGWVRTNNLVSLSNTEFVERWDGPRIIELGLGDWAGTYEFAADGRWKLDYTQSFPEGGHSRGRLRRSGRVVWAAPGDGQGGDTFLIEDDGSLCWTMDLTMCAPEKAVEPQDGS